MTSTSNSLDYSKLYAFYDPLASHPFRMRIRKGIARPTAEQMRQLAFGEFKPEVPLQFDAYQGGQATDVLWSTSLWPFFVSDRTLKLLSEHEISGWTTYPVELFDRQGAPIPGYHGFAVTGPVCALDRSRSEIIDKPPPVPGGRGYQVYRGLYFDESQWDGSDMLWIDKADPVMVERVYRLFKRHKISNVQFVPLDEDERETK